MPPEAERSSGHGRINIWLYALGMLLALGSTACATPLSGSSTRPNTPSSATALDQNGTASPTAAPLDLSQPQIGGIIAQFESVEIGHAFQANAQQSGAVVTFYDVTNGEHATVATWGLQSGSIIGNPTAETTAEKQAIVTSPLFRFEQGEGATIATSLLKAMQTTEANSGSNTISTLCPVAVPPDATYTAEYQMLPIPPTAGAALAKHPALVFLVTYPNGGTQTMINPYTETAISTPGFLYFPDGLHADQSFGTADAAKLYQQHDPRALVYALENPLQFQRILTGGINPIEPGAAAATFQAQAGQPLTAEVAGTGSAAPTIFLLDGAVVVVG